MRVSLVVILVVVTVVALAATVLVVKLAADDGDGDAAATRTSSALPGSSPASRGGTAPRPTVFAAGDVPSLLAVGMPYADDSAGAVDVFWPDGRTQHLTYAGLDLPDYVEGAFFGSSIVTADLNGDGLTDLVVAAPGNVVDGYYPKGYLTEKVSKQPPGRSGRVYLLLASKDGFDADDVVRLPLPTHEYDLMGQAIAVTTRTGGRHDVWVGASFLGVAGKPQAGRLYRVEVSATGQPRLADELTANSPGIAGKPSRDDGFGAVLAPAPGGLLVGMPNRTVDGRERAGAVLQILTDARTGAPTRSRIFVQGSYGLPDSPEKNDLFGATITPGGHAVGAPEENLGRAANAGAVQQFSASPGGRGWLVPGPLLTRDSPGVPDSVHAYEYFGQTLATGTFACPGVQTVAIGTRVWHPFGKADSHGGNVVLVPIGADAGSCPARELTRVDLGFSPDALQDGADDLTPIGTGSGQRLVMGRSGEHAPDKEQFAGRVVLWRAGDTTVLSPLTPGHNAFGTSLSSRGSR